MMLFALGIMLVNLTPQFVTSELTPVINTTTGPVQGEILQTVHSVPYAAFKGIRFAEPPVGYLRFQPPVPVTPWTEVLNATVDPPACPQKDSSGDVVGSEDCLFLNVATPVTNLSQPPPTLKSVMVWIYGGAFVTGSSTLDGYRPDFILERDVVYVSLNYRLGALGFLTLNHPNATGNAALKDQNLALKWVQANIEKFGGDPKNVTIFGESAGAVSVGFQILSDTSVGLFSGAISMSGVPLNPWGFTTNTLSVWRAERLAAAMGTLTFDKENLLTFFLAASVEDLVKTALYVNPFTPFTPTLEDSSVTTDPFISECSLNKYNSGNFTKVPQLFGFMQQETVTFLGDLDEYLKGVISDLLSEIATLGETPDDTLASLMVLPTVQGDLIDGLGEEALEALVNVTTDALFKAQIDMTQKILTKENDDNPIYYYDTTFYTNRSRHNLNSNVSLDGAGHADDIAYIFYLPENNYNLSLSSPMGLTIYRVSTMFTNFAKYSNPTPDWVDEYPLNITWPVSGSSGTALEIGNELSVVPRPISDTTRLIQKVLEPFLAVSNGCS